jgi:hypothetical protein
MSSSAEQLADDYAPSEIDDVPCPKKTDKIRTGLLDEEQ